MHYIGKLNKNRIGKYANKIVTFDVVLTEERRLHIYENHTKDYEQIIENIDRVVLNPNEVLEDLKHKDTILLIDKLEKDNLNVVIKLNIVDNESHPKNSVMTAWIIREKNLQKLRKNTQIIYKNE
ncbi:MAG: hypothetical protein HFJ30_04315 [Clostridia bacterium]|nr:hypothetical protein [Clostridia bacterium]MCI9413257.1 hypothetical protein [Clostridia bacterium]